VRRWCRAWLLVAVSFAAPGALAADKPDKSDEPGDSPISAKFAYDWTTGKYGRARDSTASIGSLTVTADFTDYSVDVVLPYLRQTGPGRLVLVPGRRPIVVIGPDEKVSGLGDVTGGVTRYVLNQEDHGIDLDLGVIVKFATASADKGLGTGKYDYSIQSAIAREMGGFNATLTGGYTFVGKQEGQDYHNAFYGSLDLAYEVTKSTSVGVTYSHGASIIPGSPASRDAQLYVAFNPWKGTKLEVYYLKGWSYQSPDRGAGISASMGL
jgi:hypothetical protein